VVAFGGESCYLHSPAVAVIEARSEWAAARRLFERECRSPVGEALAALRHLAAPAQRFGGDVVIWILLPSWAVVRAHGGFPVRSTTNPSPWGLVELDAVTCAARFKNSAIRASASPSHLIARACSSACARRCSMMSD